jgi:hypothetical protein
VKWDHSVGCGWFNAGDGSVGGEILVLWVLKRRLGGV